MKEKFKLTSLERKWVMYDVGNSAFTLMVSTLIPIYFNMLASETVLDSVTYLAYWGDIEVKGFVIGCAVGRTLYVLHFSASYADYAAMESMLNYIVRSVTLKETDEKKK